MGIYTTRVPIRNVNAPLLAKKTFGFANANRLRVRRLRTLLPDVREGRRDGRGVRSPSDPLSMTRYRRGAGLGLGRTLRLRLGDGESYC